MPMPRLALACGLLLAAASVATPARADELARVASPDGKLEVRIGTIEDRRPTWEVTRNGRPLIAPSRLGFLLDDTPPRLDRQFVQAAPADTRRVDSRYDLPWGERIHLREHYNELRVHLKEETQQSRRRLDIVFRVYDDGLGFRYEFPKQEGFPQANIQEELTEFNIAGTGATAWWIPAGDSNYNEQLIRHTPLAEVGRADTPMTVRTGDGTWLAFHEAALVDYSGLWLRHVEGQRFRADLVPSSEGVRVRRALPFHTPWRSLQVADTPAGLANSDLVLNLNEPNALGDTSWFKPSKYVGIWWAMHLDTQSWHNGAKHAATTARAKEMVDFAAANGFRGVLIEGWNVGWDDDWYGNGTKFSFTKPESDFDLEGVAAYAKSKGVHLIGHHETGGNLAVYEPQLRDALDLYQRLGVDGIKTGYVTDVGGLRVTAPDGSTHFEWHDGQRGAQHYLMVVQEAAKRHIAIDSHEPIKDTGLRRTWPNWVSREGARGMEYNAWGNPPNPPEHEANLFFTRMLSGPMDFTPGIVSLQGRGQPLQSTLAKQLANYVVIYSPIVMAADLIENYQANPVPFAFIKQVPADWEDTRVLDGMPGDFVLVARKDRNSADWYLGAVTDENARTLNARLDFLAPGKKYRAQIYKDGPTANYATDARDDMAVEERVVTSKDTLPLVLAPGGGTAIRFIAK